MHIDVHFGCYPHDSHLTQRTQGVQGLTHHGRYAGGLHRVVSPAAGSGLDLLDHVYLLAIESMGSTQLKGQLQTAIMHVHCKNLLAASDLRRHDRTQAYRATAIDGNRRTKLGFQAIEHRTGAGLNATAQRPQQLQVDLLVDFHHIALMGNNMCAEGGLAEKGVNIGVSLV